MTKSYGENLYAVAAGVDEAPSLADECFGKQWGDRKNMRMRTPTKASYSINTNAFTPKRKKSSILPDSYEANNCQTFFATDGPSRRFNFSIFTTFRFIAIFSLATYAWRQEGTAETKGKNIKEMKTEIEYLKDAIYDTEWEISDVHEHFEELHTQTHTRSKKRVDIGWEIEDEEDRLEATESVIYHHEEQTEERIGLENHMKSFHEKLLLERYVQFFVFIFGNKKMYSHL